MWGWPSKSISTLNSNLLLPISVFSWYELQMVRSCLTPRSYFLLRKCLFQFLDQLSFRIPFITLEFKFFKDESSIQFRCRILVAFDYTDYSIPMSAISADLTSSNSWISRISREIVLTGAEIALMVFKCEVRVVEHWFSRYRPVQLTPDFDYEVSFYVLLF